MAIADVCSSIGDVAVSQLIVCFCWMLLSLTIQLNSYLLF